MQHAERLLERSLTNSTRRERSQRRRLAAVVDDERLRALTFALTDEVLRVEQASRAAARFRAIVGEIGVPSSLGLIDRVSLRVGAWVAPVLPWLVVPLVRRRIVRESNGVVLPADDPAFAEHIARRRAEHFPLNVNVLGEAILSNVEAEERMRLILERVARPDVDYVSLKISAVVANLDVLAFDHSVEAICERLRTLYRAAERAVPKVFVNLDMEEFRDLPLTIAAATRVLDEPEFVGVHAGIVLQAYLPDSHAAAEQLCTWAAARHARAGGTLKVRVVKGANLAMEKVEAELHGWQQAPYLTKAEVDASFKRLVSTVLDQRWSAAVRLGFASQNLLDLAWAIELTAEAANRGRIDIEMLEGMANPQARAVRDEVGEVLLYAPVVRQHDLAASIAYLTRRLDENTAPDNFLRALFTLQPGSPAWNEQATRFRQAIDASAAIPTDTRRTQDRSQPVEPADPEASFVNAPDTDWTREANRDWIARHLAHPDVPQVTLTTTIDDVDRAVAAAVAAGQRWATTSWRERRALLNAVADEMERSRGTTLALMAHTACKTIAEGDPEVSEAVDFARYYAWCTHAIEARAADGLTFAPDGVVLVASPWNFPYAIPAGGVLAALAAGNAVLLKPAPEVREVALELAQQLWRAGVPTDLLQFVATPDDEVGRHLVSHDQVDTVVLTGAYDTARLFRSWKPSIRLLAETSGKDALIITAAADEDAAIKDLVRSAFGHAGQKCSAASLAIVEATVYDAPGFLPRLAAAVESVRVGPATDLATMMGPLVGPPSPKLRRGLTELDEGEQWLVQPRCLDERTNLWSPGVRIGVRPGSWFHRTECFGPVLGVIRARDIDDAIDIQNGTDYGLTGGIHSLDEREVQHWLDRVEVGNAYVNRHITGAVVQRQPFGGWKRSAVGCGPKAGGPWYVEALGTWSGGPASGDADAFRTEWQAMSKGTDRSGLACERNTLRVLPLHSIGLYVGERATADAVALVEMAARTVGVALHRVVNPATKGMDRVRVIGTIDDAHLARCHEAGVEVDRVQPVADPAIELRRWVREQAVSTTRHRHGRLLD